MFDQAVSWMLVAPAIIYGLFSLWCGWRYFSGNKEGKEFDPPVTILKPVKGEDAESFENFASYCRQDYPVFQIVFAVAAVDDPVVQVVERLKKEYPSTDMELVADGTVHGPNHKVCNLINAFPRVKHDIVIVCDSDIRVGQDYLRRVTAPFRDEGVGLVTSLYRSSGFRNVATAIEAMGFSTELVPNVMAAQRLEGLTFALGASMAVRKSALDKIGGFAALVGYLADDYQLGNMIHRAGYRLVLSGYFVESIMKKESLKDVLSRQLRWARTMRASRPLGFFASGITQPVLAALLALMCSGFSPSVWWPVAVLGSVRVCCSLIFSAKFVRDGLMPRFLWLLPLRDLLSLCTWALSFLGNRVVWRSRSYLVLPGGGIRDLGDVSPD
jgi:ceramide glucosyltransferase